MDNETEDEVAPPAKAATEKTVEVEFETPFSWTPNNGITILNFKKGRADVPLRCAEVAKAAGVLVAAPTKSPANKATKAPATK